MAKINYTWATATPPAPDTYITRLGESKVHTVRYWDGERWHDVAPPRGAADPKVPFIWPKGARTPKPKWMNHDHYKSRLTLRNITAQSRVQWGTPFKVYEPAEVLKWLVNQGKLPADWREAYQNDMRAAQKGSAA